MEKAMAGDWLETGRCAGGAGEHERMKQERNGPHGPREIRGEATTMGFVAMALRDQQVCCDRIAWAGGSMTGLFGRWSR